MASLQADINHPKGKTSLPALLMCCGKNCHMTICICQKIEQYVGRLFLTSVLVVPTAGSSTASSIWLFPLSWGQKHTHF